MMEISAKDVMTLRARTNAGMMESKKALQEANGDMDKACELLRKWGAGRADSKVANEMKEGLIGAKIAPDGRTGVLLRLGCQTDFVARNDGFQKLLADLVEIAFLHEVTSPADLNRLFFSDASGRTVEQVIKEMVGSSIKENMAVTGLARFTTSNGQIGKYVHHNAKVGALVRIDGSADDAVRVALGEIAMHITAGMPFVPVAVSRDKVDPALLEKEKAIAAEGITGKPPAIVEKIVAGKLEKFFSDQVLLDQPFVKDESRRIRDLLADAGKASSATLRVVEFARFKVGEV